MNTEEYVVLRSELGGLDEFLGGARSVGTEGAEPEISVERAALTDRDAGDMRREKGVLGVAPAMPVMLVAPLESSAGETDVAADATPWGLRAIGALDSRFQGRGVTVAVLDTGIDAAHEAFRGKTIVQKDFTGEGDGDRNGHGTHCAGTVFGGEVGGVRIGVAPAVDQALIGKVLDGGGRGSTGQILDGIVWAVRSGANIISVSLGLDFPGLVKSLVERQGLEIEPATSRALAAYRDNVRLFDTLGDLLRAHSAMFSKTILVAAAGNESRRPRYTIATAPPATADGFISVGALGRAGATSAALVAAEFSNTDPAMSAPGVDIQSARVGGGLRTLSGTSMATPHVAGVAALWLEKIMRGESYFSVDELKGRLIGSATGDLIEPGASRVDVGAGIVQAPRN
jgi:subtilisin family serine protease